MGELVVDSEVCLLVDTVRLRFEVDDGRGLVGFGDLLVATVEGFELVDGFAVVVGFVLSVLTLTVVDRRVVVGLLGFGVVDGFAVVVEYFASILCFEVRRVV
jgi:hypothetical protein